MSRVKLLVLFQGLFCLSLSAQFDCYLSLDNFLIVRINTKTCDTSKVGSTPNMLLDIAMTPSGRLFGVTNNDLHEIDTVDASVSFISNLNINGSSFNNLMAYNDDYLLAINGIELYKIDISDGSVHYIDRDALLNNPSGDITKLGEFYYVSVGYNSLTKFQLNDDLTELTSVQDVGAMNTSGKVWGVVASNTSTCYLSANRLLAFDKDNVYEVNPSNANCTLICDAFVHGQSNVTGATSYAEIRNYIEPDQPEFYFPNVFTPNYDGQNDLLSVDWYDHVNSFKIEIYNRWGMLVTQSSNAQNIWDGTSTTGEKCSEGVYFYLLSYTDECDRKYNSTGSITLVR